MTVFAVYASGKGRDSIMGYSDIMISRGEVREVKSSVSAFHPGGRTFLCAATGLRQESVIFDDKLFIWSGRSIEAQSVLRRVFRDRKTGVKNLSNHDWVDELGVSDISFVIGQNSLEGSSEMFIYNCFQGYVDDNVFLICEGSGSGDLFFDYFGSGKFSAPSTHPHGAFPILLKNLGHMVYREVTGSMDPSKAYGLGYELFGVNVAGGFRKIPYTLDFFYQLNACLGFHMRLAVFYINEVAVFLKLSNQNPADSGNWNCEVDGFSVTNFLAPVSTTKVGTTVNLCEMQQDLRLFIVVRDNGSFSFGAYGPKAPIFYIEDSQFKWSFPEEFFKWEEYMVSKQ